VNYIALDELEKKEVTEDYKHEISDLSSTIFFIKGLFHRKTCFPILKIIYYVVYHFFFKQFQTKFHLKKRKIVNIGHELDNKILFLPQFSKIYLSFVNLWVNSLYFVQKKGKKESWDDVKSFLDQIALLYKECAFVYERCQSTTPRPNDNLSFRMKFIHFVDPHLHCFPSLHVLLVFFNYYQNSKLINKYLDDENEIHGAIQYIYDEAVKITESILYVKQHSVNCVGASLFVLSQIYPGFSEEEVKKIISDLFTYNGEGCSDKETVCHHIYMLYSELTDEYQAGNYNDYKELLLNFLESY